MAYSSFFFFFLRKKKKNNIRYSFYRNISGSVAIEMGFTLPIIFFLFAYIYIFSMRYMTMRSMDLVAQDISRRYLYTKSTVSKNITNIAQLKTDVCKINYIMLKCTDLRFYIDAYDHGKFDTITASPGLENIFNGSNLKPEWLKKNNNPSFSTDYFKDNADNIFIVRIGYPGVSYAGVSMTQGQ
jgi:Flp pilus assembly protein TadG